MVYLHRGGYVYPLRESAHMAFIMHYAAAARARQVVVVEYALAPGHPYPAEVVQVIAAVGT